MESADAGGRPAFTPATFGARGDGTTKDTAAVQGAIRACAAAGGGTVYVPPGKYLIAPIYLASNVTLHLEAGSVLLGSREKRDYRIVTRRYAGKVGPTIEALINGDDLERVTIAGRGTIDGQGETFWGPLRQFFATPKDKRPTWEGIEKDSEEWIYETPWARPRLVEFQRCRDLHIEGVTLQNSGFWNLNPMFCENVVIHGVTLFNPEGLAPNGDGMDINSCRNVRVSDCFLDVNDDCICLKSGWNEPGHPTENVTITNCVTRAGHGGVVMGSDMSGGIRNVTVSNCIFSGTEIGIRLKTMRGRGAAVENINVTNVIMDNVPHPIHMDMHYWKPMPPEPAGERTPHFRNLRFSHIDATRAEAAAYLHGLEEAPIEDLRIDGLRVVSKKPFHARHVRGLELRNVRLECAEGPELVLEDVADVEIDRFQARGARGNGPAIRLTRARRAYVHDSAASGAGATLVDQRECGAGQVQTANNPVFAEA